MGRYKKRKDGRYATTIMVGYKADGRPNNIFLSAKTEKALRDKIAELKAKTMSGELIKESDTLFRDYVDNWFAIYKASVGINTKAMYDNIVNKHIKPELGYLPLNKLVRSDVQKLINDNQEHPRTCEQIKMTLVQILNSAIEDKLITENVAKKVTLPKRHKKSLNRSGKRSHKKSRFYPSGRSPCKAALLFWTTARRSSRAF